MPIQHNTYIRYFSLKNEKFFLAISENLYKLGLIITKFVLFYARQTNRRKSRSQ